MLRTDQGNGIVVSALEPGSIGDGVDAIDRCDALRQARTKCVSGYILLK